MAKTASVTRKGNKTTVVKTVAKKSAPGRSRWPITASVEAIGAEVTENQTPSHENTEEEQIAVYGDGGRTVPEGYETTGEFLAPGETKAGEVGESADPENTHAFASGGPLNESAKEISTAVAEIWNDASEPLVKPARAKSPPNGEFGFQLQVQKFQTISIPGLAGVEVGHCFVKVTDLPELLDDWMEVNPRVPNRTNRGVLSGPVVRGITDTLLNEPDSMALKNQGIYLLTKNIKYEDGQVSILLNDRALHGIINGGHTYATIRDAVETASAEFLPNLHRAYVPLHLYSGVSPESVADIAEGLNRNKQVDDSSLANLQGKFRPIQQAMAGQVGAEEIAYHQGARGEVDISDVLVYLEMFNPERFDATKHPSYLYSRTKSAQEFYLADLEAIPSAVALIVPHMPEILRLSDMLRQATPEAAKRQGFEFGRMKTSPTAKKRAKVAVQSVKLPFLGATMSYKVPDGWLYPMLASFRANVRWDLAAGVFEWITPLSELVPLVIERLVAVCIEEHREAGQKPDRVGKTASAYSQMYDKVRIELLTGAEKPQAMVAA